MQRMLMTSIAIALAALFSACAASEEKAASAPVPAAAAAASPAENVEQVLIKLEREWAEAGVKADAAALDRLIADDWSLTGWDGQTQTKAQILEEIKSGAYKPESVNLDNLKVRAFGDVAVVTLSQMEKSKYKGKDSSGRYLYTDVWVKRNGKWQVVATHGTKVEPPKQ